MITKLQTGVFAVNTYIVALDAAQAFVLDPGGDAGAIIESLGAQGLTPVAAVLSHAHFDHVGALGALKQAFPQMQVLAHEEEAPFIGKNALQAQLERFGGGGFAQFIRASVPQELPEADVLLKGGETLFAESANFGGGFTVLHTGGHSAGSICLYNAEQAVLFSGDTLFAGGYGRTDLHGGNAKQLLQSLRALCALPPQTRVYPGHDGETTISSEKALLRC